MSNESSENLPNSDIKLHFKNGQILQLPTRKNLLGGLKFTRRFSNALRHPYDEIEWICRDVRIMDWKTKAMIYERLNVETPAHWDDNAVRITADKYLFGREPESPAYENSFKEIFDRIANTYAVWGWEEGYFATLEDVEIFTDEIKAMLVKQIWAPNSPVWFNIGHWEQWRWGRPDLREEFTGTGNEAFYASGESKDNVKVNKVNSTYEHPQCSACFLTEVHDNMESILGHIKTEGRVFSSGSGVGINISSLRSSKEPIRGKGKSSGPISFDKGWDRMAGAIRSGGKTRRAARMVLMFSDHPDIFDFVEVKNNQEDIAKVILREHNVHVELKRLAELKLESGTPAERAAAAIVLSLPLTTNKEFDAHMDGLLYGETLSHQNANHSVSLKGDFWSALHSGGMTHTRWVTNPARIEKTFRASELLEAMANSIWENGEPGVHNNDLINLWNPVKSLGSITTSNPCSEYVFLNNTSCNLSSFNAYRFLKSDSGRKEFDAEALVHAARLAMVCADLNVERGGFPIPEIARGTFLFRTTGIGYANVGGALMALGVPYDSDEGRWIASQLCSVLTAACWAASQEMGRELGTYLEYEATKHDLTEVLNLHHLAENLASMIAQGLITEQNLEDKIDFLIEDSAKSLPSAQGVDGRFALRAFAESFLHVDRLKEERLVSARGVEKMALELWQKVIADPLMRNAFVTVMAPTGTISAPLGCYDEGTTSIEPDYTLVKWKQLSGGGSLKMFNRLALEGLETLGYTKDFIREAAFEVAGIDSLFAACDSDLDELVKHLIQDPVNGDAGPIRLIWRKMTEDKTEAEIRESLLRLMNPANMSSFTFDEQLVTNGASHVESLPWLRQSDMAVFDCAVSNGDGKRAIEPNGHIRMLGALQPFISGACSKTVNLPVRATRQDIYNCLVYSHKLGIKCIALFRAGSKGNSAYLIETPETRKFKSEYIWNELVGTSQKSIQNIVTEASKPKKRVLPGRRLSQTVKFSIAGQISGYLTVGIYPEGTCGEVFGRLGQVGSFASGMFEAYCKLLSTSLQFGIPLREVVKGFRNYSFEPSGFCRVGDDNEENVCEDIRSCSSVVDLISKILFWLFPEELDFRLRDTCHGQYSPQLLAGSKIEILPPVELEGEENTSSLNGAAICPKCHSLAYVQDGKCKSCRSCGYKDGGCGE